MNLDNWQRREMGATASYGDSLTTRYYGYAAYPTAADTDTAFAIRKVTAAAGIETPAWNDNSEFCFGAKWSERAANFTAPTGALGLTYSGSNPITFTWTRLAGVNTYAVVVKNQEGVLFTPTGDAYPFTSDRTQTARYLNATTHLQRLPQSGTYSVVLQAVNAGGTLTATYSNIVI